MRKVPLSRVKFFIVFEEGGVGCEPEVEVKRERERIAESQRDTGTLRSLSRRNKAKRGMEMRER